MLLIFHVIIAILSLIHTGYLFLRPSKPGFQVSYSLVALTLATGFYLVFSSQTNLTRTCVSGLVYLGVVSLGIILAKHKLNIRTE